MLLSYTPKCCFDDREAIYVYSCGPLLTLPWALHPGPVLYFTQLVPIGGSDIRGHLLRKCATQGVIEALRPHSWIGRNRTPTSALGLPLGESQSSSLQSPSCLGWGFQSNAT